MDIDGTIPFECLSVMQQEALQWLGIYVIVGLVWLCVWIASEA